VRPFLEDVVRERAVQKNTDDTDSKDFHGLALSNGAAVVPLHATEDSVVSAVFHESAEEHSQ